MTLFRSECKQYRHGYQLSESSLMSGRAGRLGDEELGLPTFTCRLVAGFTCAIFGMSSRRLLFESFGRF